MPITQSCQRATAVVEVTRFGGIRVCPKEASVILDAQRGTCQFTRSPSTSTMIRAARSASFASSIFRRGISHTPFHSPAQSQGHLPASQSPIVPKLHFFNSVTADGAQIPTYRILDASGAPIDGAELPDVCFAFEMQAFTY